MEESNENIRFNHPEVLMRRLIISAVISLAAGQAAQAANNATDSYNDIKDLIFYSNAETIVTAWAGYLSVRFTQPLVWSTPGTCDQTTVAIRPDDKHMISAVQTAYALGKPLRVYTDDAQTISGTYCILRAVLY
jgi:hypothetical protein